MRDGWEVGDIHLIEPAVATDVWVPLKIEVCLQATAVAHRYTVDFVKFQAFLDAESEGHTESIGQPRRFGIFG